MEIYRVPWITSITRPKGAWERPQETWTGRANVYSRQETLLPLTLEVMNYTQTLSLVLYTILWFGIMWRNWWLYQCQRKESISLLVSCFNLSNRRLLSASMSWLFSTSWSNIGRYLDASIFWVVSASLSKNSILSTWWGQCHPSVLSALLRKTESECSARKHTTRQHTHKLCLPSLRCYWSRKTRNGSWWTGWTCPEEWGLSCGGPRPQGWRVLGCLKSFHHHQRGLLEVTEEFWRLWLRNTLLIW